MKWDSGPGMQSPRLQLYFPGPRHEQRRKEPPRTPFSHTYCEQGPCYRSCYQKYSPAFLPTLLLNPLVPMSRSQPHSLHRPTFSQILKSWSLCPLPGSSLRRAKAGALQPAEAVDQLRACLCLTTQNDPKGRIIRIPPLSVNMAGNAIPTFPECLHAWPITLRIHAQIHIWNANTLSDL